MSDTEVRIPVGSVEYLYADLTGDITLDGTVEMGLGAGADVVTWTTAEWVGVPDFSRSARVLLDGTMDTGTYYLFARVTDNPEVPIVVCGRVRIVTR
jgi:hypothetical protein